MKCLLRYNWVKLPRASIPQGKGVMGHWAKLATRAAYRPGKARYCGHLNNVAAGAWAGGIVGLKSILGIKGRAKALAVMEHLTEMGFLSYRLDSDTKKPTYSVTDLVSLCSGQECPGQPIYTINDHGFLCIPLQRIIRIKYPITGECLPG